jgi:putative DNA methylase
MTYKKKLIEVALPLEAINIASAREKSIRHGHPSTLHLWWARRPLAAARAVIFAQMVDDPSAHPDIFPTEKKQEKERQRLFRIIEELVKWENTTNETVLQQAREEIWQSWRYTCAENADHSRAKELFDRYKLPAFHDPFAGGGALPLEAQRLGLESYASDLNPVAVLINKAMIEIPPKFAGKQPVNPEWQQKSFADKMGHEWKGAQGLAEDVRYYGQWMRDEAEKRIGHLYPKIEVTAAMAEERPDLKKYVGRKLTVIAWLWARTVKSPNPAFANVDVPLVSTFMLSTKAGKEAYVKTHLGARPSWPHAGETPALPGYTFEVKIGKPADAESATRGTTAGKRAAFRCLMSDTPITYDYIREEGKAGRMGVKLMAIVAEGDRGRVYLSTTPEMEAIALSAQPTWRPETPLHGKCRVNVSNYGLDVYGDLFTSRQLVALTTFSDLVQEAREQVFLGARASRPHSAKITDQSKPATNTSASRLLAGGTPALPAPTWHSRGYLPHWEAGAIPQSITFRLHDSLPRTLLETWREELAHLPDTEATRERRQRIEAALDAGHGECLLRNSEVGALVEHALLHFDQQRYKLHAWVIMPNHVHVLITPFEGYTLSSILHSWKSFTAKSANQLLGRTGTFWLEEYFDRSIRNEEHYNRVVEYIHNNPVKAGLCVATEEWGLSSARYGGEGREEFGGEERAGRPRSQDEASFATAYADAVAVYLGFGVDKLSDRHSALTRWDPTPTASGIINTFSRQALPMSWDYTEGNPFSEASGNFEGGIGWIGKVIERSLSAYRAGIASSSEASTQFISADKVISTDPPYYDNIAYADLSDFFYVWLRRSLKSVYPDLFTTLAVPKAEELVATPYRHGSKAKAESFFLDGMTKAMHRLAEQAHPAFPVTIYYAFKQAESDGVDGTTNTGWDTFLAAVIEAGFAISGTWPMRTELSNRMIGAGSNALASSIILVCRQRPASASTATRRDFVAALKGPSREEREQLEQEKKRKELSSARREEIRVRLEDNLPAALVKLQSGNIAPVDLAQAAIGPGMAVYSRYAKVLDADGNPVPVRAALALINQVLDEALAEQEGDFDADTRWALTWFEQMGFNDGDYGIAEQLSKSKNTAVQGLVEAGIILSKAGKVRLLKPAELPGSAGVSPVSISGSATSVSHGFEKEICGQDGRAPRSPRNAHRLTVWEMVHQLIRVLEVSGESAAADLVAKLGTEAEIARELCYRLYTLCERKKRANEAMSYNALVQSWPEITRLAQEKPSAVTSDTYNLFDQE